MSRLVPLLLAVSGLALTQAEEKPAEKPAKRRPLVLQVTLDDEAITPGTARYLHRAIREAEQRDAECLIVVLDTPGGLLDSTRSIVKEFLATRTCVVVYVSPAGSRAASAGVFITMAAHVAAMAPGTTIGAAHPVQIGGLPLPSSPNTPPEVKKTDEHEKEDRDQDDKHAEEDEGKGQQDETGSDDEKGDDDQADNDRQKADDGTEPKERTDDGTEAKEKTDKEEENGKDDEDSSKRERSAPQSVMEEKIVNDTVAWARALAGLRKRNAEWAARAVRESVSVTAEEAVEEGVVDFLAADLSELLEKLDGREVTLAQGPHTLHTSNAEVEPFPMWWGEQVLAVLSRPTVAFLLMMFGFYGIMFELYSPGWGVAGTLGVICLLLAFFGLAVLPVNYLGLALIVLAFALFAAEVYVTSFGLLTLGGVVCLVLGGVMLIDSPIGFTRVSLEVVLPIALATGFITLCLLGGVVRAHRRRARTGDEALIGIEAPARTDFAQKGGRYVGMVFVHGEWWKATSAIPVAAGQECRIEDRQGLALIVSPSETALSET